MVGPGWGVVTGMRMWVQGLVLGPSDLIISYLSVHVFRFSHINNGYGDRGVRLVK
jgi:hypothetical protein